MTLKLPNKLKVLMGACVLVMLLAGGIASVMYEVYIAHSGATPIRLFAGWLPAARVGKSTVAYGTFLKMRASMALFTKQTENRDLNAQDEQILLYGLMRQRAVADYAASKKIDVSDEDVRASFAEGVAQASSTISNVAQYLKDTYGWVEEEYRANVVRPVMLEQKIALSFSTDTQTQPGLFEAWLAPQLKEPNIKIYLVFPK